MVNGEDVRHVVSFTECSLFCRPGLVKFFTPDHLMIDGNANDCLLKHLQYVAHNTMGRFIAETASQVRVE